MSLLIFSDHFYSAVQEYQIPEHSAIEAGIIKAEDILRTNPSTLTAAHQALLEIQECFGNDAAAENPFLVGRIYGMVSAEMGIVQEVRAKALQGLRFPSLVMLGFPMPQERDLSIPLPGTIPCTIDEKHAYVAPQDIIDFLDQRFGISISPECPKEAMGKVLEAISKDTQQKLPSRERVLELARRISADVRVFSVHHIQSSSEIPSSSVRQLVDGYKTRSWGDHIPIKLVGSSFEVPGYASLGSTTNERFVSHNLESDFLEQVLQAHNRQFGEFIPHVQSTDEGYDEKLDVHPDEEIYVRADLHSDLHSLLAQLDMLKATGRLDENYRCKPGFHMVFLGDYMDRGANDIEILTLLLCLRMENPASVHLIRGNHEDIEMQSAYSDEAQWLVDHELLVSECYKSFPLALCVGASDARGNRQYVHFSHGAFSLAVDLEPLFEGDCSCMVVDKIGLMSQRIFEGRDDKAARKQKSAFKILEALPEWVRDGSGYAWFDVTPQSGETKRGYGLSAEDVHAYARYAGGKSPVKAFFMGHAHEFRQFLVMRGGRHAGKKKVIATTMPVGRAGGVYAGVPEVRQGILFRVAPKVRDWTKRLAVTKGRGRDTRMRLLDSSCGMYDSLPVRP